MATRLYRVFSLVYGADLDDPGGARYIPPQGRGRIDNPEHYQVRYATLQPEAAVTEVLGSREPAPIGRDSLRGSPLLPGSVLALATFEVPTLDCIRDLDDPGELSACGLRPSRVITRDYGVTQRWALQIFRETWRGWIGVRWWSYYDSLWTSVAVWKHRSIKLRHVEALSLDHDAVIRAAHTLRRPMIADR